MRPPTALAALVLAAACGRAPGAEAVAPPPLRVLAAASLAELSEDLARLLPPLVGRPLLVGLGSSADLSRQIQQGAPADWFLSADPAWVDVLPALAGRLEWLGNRLACVVLADAPAPGPGAVRSLVLGGENVPLGRYARQALPGLGFLPDVRVVVGSDARDVLAKLVAGAAEMAVVYATDAAAEPRVRVAHTVPSELHAPVRYVAAALSEEGLRTLPALGSDAVRQAAERRGFTWLPPGAVEPGR